MKRKSLNFKYQWRDYQEKFLDGFVDHISDNHLHVVAPPGSGKTILGLEIMLRIGKPTLVLSPTLTIRNQWKERLEEFFIKSSADQVACSLNIKKPQRFTFSTYQSLYALHKSFREKEEQALITFIKAHKIETLVLDEAHHLKNEWWHSLFLLKSIENLTIVALTATPPYDSSSQEIQRYFELCGPIDDEIAVPNLIKNGDLCPHQDFIHFSIPDEVEIRYIVKYREEISSFIEDLKGDENFRNILKSMKIYSHTEISLETVYQNPSFFSAILIFLNSCGISISKEKLQILGFNNANAAFPSFSYEWAEILLQYILVDEREMFSEEENILMPLERRLRRIGVLIKRKVDFVGDNTLYQNLANSPTKLKSIVSIINEAYADLKNNIRAVILTDYIRKEFLNFDGANTKELNQLGVVSIFQYILSETTIDRELAVLTGSLVIIHQSVLFDFQQIIQIDVTSAETLPHQPGYQIIRLKESVKNKVVEVITELFQTGKIKILVGTKSLLGEGWDAPSINTLILASYVGSFVSSNQMRGRAIRTEANNIDKVGNIWHLACLDPTREDGGKDIENLSQRFLAFSGVSISGEPYIENGIERMNLPIKWNDETDINSLNVNMLKLSKSKDSLRKRWNKAIANGEVLVKELKIPFQRNTSYADTKKLISLNAFKYLFFQIAVGLSFFLPEYFLKNFGAILNKGFLVFLYFLLGSVAIGFGPKTFKAIRLYLLFGNQFIKTQKIAKALLLYLQDLGEISDKEVVISSGQRINGTFYIYLTGASQYESSLFINQLDEIIAPIENPRYLLVRGSWFKKWIGYKTYYVIPAIHAKKKTQVLAFAKYWNKYVDGSKPMYMYTFEGRKELLKARFSHIKYEFEKPAEKAITWR